MILHTSLSLTHLLLAPLVAAVTPDGDVLLLDSQSLALKQVVVAGRAASVFATGRDLTVTEIATDDEPGAIVRYRVGAKAVELSRAPVDGDAAMVTSRGAGVAVGTIDGGAWIGVLGGAGHSLPQPASFGDTGATVWTFHTTDEVWTLEVHPFDGTTLGAAMTVGSMAARGTGCGARAVDVGGTLALVYPTTGGVDVLTIAGETHLAATQPCIEEVVALPGGGVAVLLGPDAELVVSGGERPWKLGTTLPHATLPAPRLAPGVRDGTVLVAVDGPLREIDRQTGHVRASTVPASAVAVLR